MSEERDADPWHWLVLVGLLETNASTSGSVCRETDSTPAGQHRRDLPLSTIVLRIAQIIYWWISALAESSRTVFSSPRTSINEESLSCLISSFSLERIFPEICRLLYQPSIRMSRTDSAREEHYLSELLRSKLHRSDRTSWSLIFRRVDYKRRRPSWNSTISFWRRFNASVNINSNWKNCSNGRPLNIKITTMCSKHWRPCVTLHCISTKRNVGWNVRKSFTNGNNP